MQNFLRVEVTQSFRCIEEEFFPENNSLENENIFIKTCSKKYTNPFPINLHASSHSILISILSILEGRMCLAEICMCSQRSMFFIIIFLPYFSQVYLLKAAHRKQSTKKKLYYVHTYVYNFFVRNKKKKISERNFLLHFFFIFFIIIILDTYSFWVKEKWKLNIRKEEKNESI